MLALALLITAAALAVPADGMVRAGVGMPDVVHLQADFAVAEHWTVGARLGSNLGMLTYGDLTAEARWWPAATCWGCGGPDAFAFGFGPEVLVGPAPHLAAVIAAAGVEAAYVHRFGERVGLVLSQSFAPGLTVDVPWGERGFRPEPAFTLALLQAGVSW
ncbi:MAG: hypothetical protein ABIO70_17960 [Pseudomonadota bacterium]